LDKLIDAVKGILLSAQKWESGDHRRGTSIASWSKIDGEPAFGIELNDGTEFSLKIEEA
jgi:hypothetical protein